MATSSNPKLIKQVFYQHFLKIYAGIIEIFCQYFNFFRSLNFVYKNETQVRDIDTYRFIFDDNNFKNSNPENCGFCRAIPRDMYGRQKGSYCLPDGILDISGCRK